MKLKIIYIEDNKIDQLTFITFIDNNLINYDCTFADSIKDAKKILKKNKFDMAIIDFKLGDGTAFNIIDILGDTPFIILTGAGDENIAIQAMKKGAYDYIIKDLTGSYLKNLPSIIESTIKRKALEEEIKNYQKNLEKMVELRTEALKKEIEEHEKDAENTLFEKKISDEKLKEFSILCESIKQLTNNDFSEDNLCNDLVASIANFLQYPNLTRVKMVLNAKEYSTKSIKNAINNIKVDISDNNSNYGFIEVSRVDEFKELDNELFTEHEIKFIENISEKIVTLVKIIKALNQKDNTIKELKAKLENINNKIEDLKKEVISGFNNKMEIDLNKLTDEFVDIKKILIN